SLILSLSGGLAGLLVAWLGVHGLAAMRPPLAAQWIVPIGLGPGMLTLTMAISIVTGLAFGLAPALAASQMDPLGSIREHPPGRLLRPGHPVRTALVAGQLALALVLLVGSGLLLRSFTRLTGRTLNYERAGLLMFDVRVTTPPARQLG